MWTHLDIRAERCLTTLSWWVKVLRTIATKESVSDWNHGKLNKYKHWQTEGVKSGNSDHWMLLIAMKRAKLHWEHAANVFRSEIGELQCHCRTIFGVWAFCGLYLPYLRICQHSGLKQWISSHAGSQLFHLHPKVIHRCKDKNHNYASHASPSLSPRSIASYWFIVRHMLSTLWPKRLQVLNLHQVQKEYWFACLCEEIEQTCSNDFLHSDLSELLCFLLLSACHCEFLVNLYQYCLSWTFSLVCGKCSADLSVCAVCTA